MTVDGTPVSDRALDHGQELARAAGAELVLVHAVEPTVQQTVGEHVSGPEDVGDRLVMEGTDDAEERGAEILAAAARSRSGSSGAWPDGSSNGRRSR